MGIKITQIGGDKSQHHRIERAADLYLTLLGVSPRMKNTLNIKISIQNIRSKGVRASVETIPEGSKATKDYLIRLDRGATIGKQLESLAHEMVHVWQRCQNTLQTRIWKSDGKPHDRWNGFEVGVRGSIDYYDRYWEREAFSLQTPLKLCFMDAYKGDAESLEQSIERLETKMVEVMKLRDEFKEEQIAKREERNKLATASATPVQKQESKPNNPFAQSIVAHIEAPEPKAKKPTPKTTLQKTQQLSLI